jgi:hypothetical protein
MLMGFDDFQDRLKEIKADFLKAHGRDMISIIELEQYLVRRKLTPRKSKRLKSLRGTGL